MIIKAVSVMVAPGRVGPLTARCPSCRQLGTFDGMGADLFLDDTHGNFFSVGHRRCPNTSCHSHLFVVIQDGRLVASYPALRIDFDATNVPASIVAALEEAITCHANACFTASAIMVRKTLEQLCRERQAQGKDLKEKIRDLGTKIVLPQELLAGLDDLRLLGNDAAHIESREYDKIGRDEVEAGVEFAKEVLKAAYQYSALLSRLRSLKKNP